MLHRCFLSLVLFSSISGSSHAGISATQDVTPHPSSTHVNSELYVGKTSFGSVRINSGSDVISGKTYVGYDSGAIGTVTVDGVGSTWSNSGLLYFGYEGNGTLNVANGGIMTNGHLAYLGYGTTASGIATVDGIGSIWSTNYLLIGESGTGRLEISNGALVDVSNGIVLAAKNGQGIIRFNTGTLNTGSLVAAFAQLEGSGTINTNGLITDIDLVFDQSQGLQQQLILSDETDQNITINLDVNGDGSLGAGYSEQGSLTIAGGRAVSSTYGHLGYRSGSTGTARIDGVGSSWSNSGGLHVGERGVGSLEIIRGANVNTNLDGYIGQGPGASGSALVDGIGSSWTIDGGLNVGESGVGSMTISSGGQVTSNDGSVGSGSGSTGTVIVDGAGSNWTNSRGIRVGGSGSALVRIENGGSVSSAYGWLGYHPGPMSEVIVDGADSTWANTGELAVGYNGSARLTITNGGAVYSTSGQIGRSSGSEGSVLVAGNGSNWEMSSRLLIGGGGVNGGMGTLTIGVGGLVKTLEETIIFPKGLLSLEGGSFSAAAIRPQGDGRFNWTSGRLQIEEIGASLANQAGILAPGEAIGSTTINGNYTQQNAATLEIEIGGPATGELDVITVNGSATLGGTLDVRLVDVGASIFSPAAGDTFRILTATGGIVNQFDQELLPSLGDELVWRVLYGANAVSLAVTLPGDFNGDFFIDAADYVAWRKNDGTQDGYDAWRVNFGRTVGGGGGTAASSATHSSVPEPASILLIVLGWVSARWNSRRIRERWPR